MRFVSLLISMLLVGQLVSVVGQPITPFNANRSLTKQPLGITAPVCPGTVLSVSSPSASTLGTTGSYTVPSGANYKYRITVKGAKGGNGAGNTSGGNTIGKSGATIVGEFVLLGGQTIEAIAGAMGGDVVAGLGQGGGGGGSGVRLSGAATPLVIAGGGAGTGYFAPADGSLIAGNGQGGAGGIDGAGGGGLLSKGGDGVTSGVGLNPGGGGAGYNGTGGLGRIASVPQLGVYNAAGNGGGGYGGGGGGQTGPGGAAGGGGYTGGTGGQGNSTARTGGGGSSVNYGTNQANTAGNNAAGGSVTVECLGVAAAFAPTFTTNQPACGTTGGVTINLTGDFDGSTNSVEYAIVAGSSFSGSPSFSTISAEPLSVTSGTGTVASNAGNTYTVRVRLIYNPTIFTDYTYTLTSTYTQFTSQPVAGSSVCAGSSVSVPVSVTTNETLTYAWYKDGASVSGQTTANLTLSNVQTAQAGNYQVVVSSGCSSLTSSAFSLSVTAFSFATGPQTAAYAVGPTDANDDFTNRSVAVATNTLPGSSIDPAALSFVNSVSNTCAVSANNLSLVPLPPANSAGVPANTVVTISYKGASASYISNGTSFLFVSSVGSVGGNPISATNPVRIDNLTANANANYGVTIDLPSGTPLSTDPAVQHGFGVSIAAFLDQNGSGLPSGQPQNQTIDRVYTGFLQLLKQSSIIQDGGPSVQGSNGVASTSAKSAAAGNRIGYSVAYTNISESQPVSGQGNVVLSASNVSLLDDGSGTSSNFARDTDGNGLNDTSHIPGSATATQGTLTFSSGIPPTTSVSNATSGTTAATDVTRYGNLLGGTVAPGSSGRWYVERLVNAAISSLTIGNGATISYEDANQAGTTLNGSSNVVLVSISPALEVILSGSATVCAGQSATLVASITNGTSPYSLTLSDGSSTTAISTYSSGQAIVVSPSVSTTYTITALTDANQVAASSSTGEGVVAVTLPPVVGFSANNLTVSCSQPVVSLTATGAVSYTVDGPASMTQTTPGVISLDTPGTYTLTGANASGCTAFTTVTISSSTSLITTAGASVTVASVGSVVSLTASGGSRYQWSGPATASFSSAVSSSAVSASLTTAGPQVFTVVIGEGSCSTTQQLSVLATNGPDLTPNISLPDAVFPAAPSSKDFVVQLFEVGWLPTSSGSITITLTAPYGYTLSYDGSISTLNVTGGLANPVSVQNSLWQVSSKQGGEQLSLSIQAGALISAHGVATIGLTITRTLANAGSVSNLMVNVQDDTGRTYDINAANNIYVRVLNGL